MRPLYVCLLLVPALFLAGCSSPSSSSTPPPPPPATYTISGTAADLAGSGLVLQDNGGDNLTVSANGVFQFATAITSGNNYSVTVLTQPSSPAQQCTVANASGPVNANVTNVKVECGHDEWVWMTGAQTVNQQSTNGTLGTAAPANTPGGRQTPATWTDSSGDLWLFGGYGPDSSNTLLPMNDLWKFSAGQWTWMAGPTTGGQSGTYGTLGTASSSNTPGARFEAASWTDTSGNFWLFGGIGFDSAGHERDLNDLWKYSAGQWTWMAGANVGSQNGTYGTLGTASASNIPGARNSAAFWVDSSGDAWLFGGIGFDETNLTVGQLNDLWKYSAGQWTWMGGSKTRNQSGVYGTQGVAASSNIPGARASGYFWSDPSGNLWLFGGNAYDSNGTNGSMNDLWEYSGGQWTWVLGSKTANGAAVYGTMGTAAANNTPGARVSGIAWSDASGNGWIFGGSAATTSGTGFANDLWKFSGGQWTWMSGANTANPTATYGTQGALVPGNTPGASFSPSPWVDANGNLWFFGGYGPASGANGNLNDLWMYMP